MIKLFAALLLSVLAISQNPNTPVWAEVYQESFIQSYSTTTVHVNGQVYFDSQRNMMRVDRQDGKYDMFCNSVLPNVSTPCTLLMRENKRYIVYPQRRMCCYCCDDAHGCGLPPRDFLKTSKFEGYQDISGQSYYKWRFPVGQAVDDFYYDTPDAQRIPKRFTNQNKTITDFIPNTYSTSPISESIFTLPNYCTDNCPLTTICGKLRNNKNNLQSAQVQ